MGHLCNFGCSVYIHVPKDKRTKLEPSSKKGTLVGYNESSKAYKIYILGLKKIDVSRDVSFEEQWLSEKEEDLIWKLMTMKRCDDLPLQQFRGSLQRKK